MNELELDATWASARKQPDPHSATVAVRPRLLLDILDVEEILSSSLSGTSPVTFC